MPALNFKNNTGQSKFTGTINYQGFNYDYIIYLTPLINPIEKQEIVSYFGNRKYKGKLCLEIDENRISESIDNDDISAFFIVNVAGIDNVASGSLQIYNWCEIKNGYDVWINDVCKISSDNVVLQEKTTPGSTGIPVDVMFILMEQLVFHNLGKKNIKLFVENVEPNASFLVPRYKKIGFKINTACVKKLQITNPEIDFDIVMEKKINPDINFSFFKLQQVIGGRYSRRKKINKRKLIKNKTYKRKYIK